MEPLLWRHYGHKPQTIPSAGPERLAAPPLAGPPGYIMGATGVQGFGTADYFVAQIPCATAREIVRREHYSHSVVNNSYVNLGVFLEGAIVGVLQ